MTPTFANEFLEEMSPAGRAAQQSLSPEKRFRFSGAARPQPTPDYGYISDPVSALEGLDPADDSYLEKQSYIFSQAPDLARIPNIQQKIIEGARQHAEAQQYFKDDPTLVDFYIDQRGKNVAPLAAIGELRKRAQDNSLKGAFLKAGGLTEEYESLRDPQTGTVDRFKMMDFVNRSGRESAAAKAAKPKELTSEAYARLLDAQDDLKTAQETSDLSDEGKKSAFKAQYKRDLNPDAKDDWDKAYAVANKKVRDAESRLQGLTRAYGSQYALPPEFGGETSVSEWERATRANTLAPTGEIDFDATGTDAAVTPSAAVPEPVQKTADFNAPVTLPDLTETDRISGKLSDDDVQAFRISGTPENPTNPLDVEQSAQAQELELVNLLSKAEIPDTPENRRKVLLAVEAKSDPMVVRLGGKVYKFPDAQKASEFRKRISKL